MIILPVTGEKIELSNNARGHPIGMHTTPRLLKLSDLSWIWG